MTDFIQRLTTLATSFSNYLPAQQDIQHIIDMGVTNFDDLAALVSNPAYDSSTRAIACWVIGRLGDDAGISVLQSALSHQEAEVRREAVMSLGLIQNVQVVEALVTCLHHDEDFTVRMVTARALGMLGGENALKALVTTLQNQQESIGVRSNAAEALADIGSAEALTALLEALSDPVAEVRFWSVYALGQIGDARALPALESVAAHDHESLPEWGKISDEALRAIENIRQ
jgi:HEAT repeat protein